MSYSVKSIYLTLQGEGFHAGRAAVFLRFAGCNLWTGKERDRAAAVCRFCDTDFHGVDGPGGGRFADARELVAAVEMAWSSRPARKSLPRREMTTLLKEREEFSAVMDAEPFVVCTGGEPLLQLDEELIAELHAAGFTVAVETNGTRPAPGGIDWVCVSPKGTAALALTSGDELKLVYPQVDAPPENFVNLDFKRFLLQPMDGPDQAENTRAATEYCLANPQWRLSIQLHKVLGIP
ncbi:7-carboxy-7-deazaguanine synthase [soil metagenome]